MKKLPATSARLIREIASQPRTRWFATHDSLFGWPQLERAGLVRRVGDRAELTDAGRSYCAANGIEAPAPPKGDEKLHLQVGQLWEVGNKLYEITDMDGPDKCYPIVMPEVARDPKINQEIDHRAKAIGAPLNAHTLLTKKPIGMTQERAWFDRPDVKPWTGSIADWKRFHGC